ncbi:uncharacterized protein LAJ45_09971 [Morchella importuna]|uniref:uncharacterized protein n=1 Tax=Morchella importuna TaxID=1174673 RepID=UPI001E8CD6B0|nr:uncharacterized protein LAJ45_09971 [Morchella importuna]KAH8146049.1 hypothetical protein LAJ45_09971 [Morchella importuna]
MVVVVVVFTYLLKQPPNVVVQLRNIPGKWTSRLWFDSLIHLDTILTSSHLVPPPRSTPQISSYITTTVTISITTTPSLRSSLPLQQY